MDMTLTLMIIYIGVRYRLMSIFLIKSVT